MSTKELAKEIEKTEKKLTSLRVKLFHARNADPKERARRAAIIKETGGILHGRLLKGSAVAWQRKIRKEWDR